MVFTPKERTRLPEVSELSAINKALGIVVTSGVFFMFYLPYN